MLQDSRSDILKHGSKHTKQDPLPASWMEFLGDEFKQPYMQKLKKFLAGELKAGKEIFPHGNDIFNAFNLTPLEKVKVVIIGQDPYHGPGQAHGLCFSVRPNVRIPPSLLNIYKEIKNEYGYEIPTHGELTSWAKQGVLLLNAVLTVEGHKAASHQNSGWQLFTDKVVEVLNQQGQGLVFLLWGAFAQKKGAGIDRSRHLVLESVHPSPLSAHRGFLGNGHFKHANQYLEKIGKAPIDWQILPHQ